MNRIALDRPFSTLAQRNAAKAWAGQDFHAAIEGDPTVQDRVTTEDIQHAFDIDYHLKNLSHTFDVFGL